MEYRVEITEPAERDLDEAYLWFYDNLGPAAADKWFRSLSQAIISLNQMPARCPVVPESQDLGREIRGETVIVLRIRHTARASLEPQELLAKGPG